MRKVSPPKVDRGWQKRERKRAGEGDDNAFERRQAVVAGSLGDDVDLLSVLRQDVEFKYAPDLRHRLLFPDRPRPAGLRPAGST